MKEFVPGVPLDPPMAFVVKSFNGNVTGAGALTLEEWVGLCPGESVSRGVSVQEVSVWGVKRVSVQRGSLSRGSLSKGVYPGGGAVRENPVRLHTGGTHPTGMHSYFKYSLPYSHHAAICSYFQACCSILMRCCHLQLNFLPHAWVHMRKPGRFFVYKFISSFSNCVT